METILTQYYQSPYGELLLGSFGVLSQYDWIDVANSSKLKFVAVFFN